MRLCHDSNGTMLARCGVGHFENTRAKGFPYFSPKSWITLLYMMNVTNSNITINWFTEDMSRFQWHHARPMWSCPLREHSCQGYIYFSPKSWITLLHRIDVPTSNISVNWFNEDMPRFQWHYAPPMLSFPLREHSCQRLRIFQPNIMKHTFAQDKCDNFKYEWYLV